MIAVTPKTHANLLRGRPLPALTEVLAVRERSDLTDLEGGGQAWQLEIAIKTGVMHQIRVNR